MSAVIDKEVLDILSDKDNLKGLGPYHGVAYAKRTEWLAGAFNHQKLPQGTYWSIWLMLAGRELARPEQPLNSFGGGRGRTRTHAGLSPPLHRWTYVVHALRVSQA